MPPPHFQSSIGAATQGQSGQHHQIASMPSSLTDLPKQIRATTKDVLQNVQNVLTNEDKGIIKASSKKAFEGIEKLLTSPDLAQRSTGDASKSSSQRGRDTAAGEGHSTNGGQGESNASAIVAKQVSFIIDKTLFDFFSDTMDQNSSERCQLLATFLYALRAVMDPICIVRQWWDVLLRPLLKNPSCDVRVCTKVQLLVTWVMTSTSLSAYEDEPFPTAIWPRPEQSAAVAASSATATSPTVQRIRKPGDAPYPVSSTRSVSGSRSTDDVDARSLALFSTPNKRNITQDSLRRFSQRIFDLYTSEAASASSKIVEDHEMQGDDNDEDGDDDGDEVKDRSAEVEGDVANNQDNVGSTWKGNLEAIILTFGEERPKAFFHHLSESFVDPHARIPILLLLTIFLRLSTLHVYHVTSTPFIRLLVLSLQLDTSKISTSLGVLALVSLIPQFPNWLANGGAGGLPALLSIFARIIDWRRVLPGWEKRASGDVDADENEREDDTEDWEEVQHLSKRLQVRKGLEWKRLTSTYDTSQTGRPDAMKLFTILYGIFPCNMIRFLRGPIDYLRKAEYQSPFQAEWEDIIDEDVVQSKSAHVLHRHRLHPALVDMTAEGEISDTQRWQEHDPASTAAYCASLCLEEDEFRAELLHPKQVFGIIDMHGEFSTHDAPTVHSDDPFNPQSSPTHANRRRSRSESAKHTNDLTLLPSDLGINPHPLLQSIQKRSPSTNNSGHRLPLGLEASHAIQMNATKRTIPDVHLRTHVSLRSALPSNTIRAASASTARSVSMQSSPSNSSNHQFKTFHPAQSTLTSHVVSPPQTRRLAQACSTVTSTPSSPGIEAVPISPLYAEDRIILGSPALSSGGNHNHLSPSAAAIANAAAKRAKRGKLSYLKQENMQLRNELNYELGQKDQLLRHIGTIHRNRVRDTVREEELQNLYQSRRSDAIQKRSLRDELESIKAEQRQGKIRHANWQSELNTKAKAMREEKKVWANELRMMKKEKEDREELIEKLERQLDENAGELFDLRERTRANAEKVDAIQRYEDKISQLETALRYWNEDMHVFERQNQELRTIMGRWEEMNMLMEASEKRAQEEISHRLKVEKNNEMLERRVKEADEIVERLSRKQQNRGKVASNGDREMSSSSSSAALTAAREDASKMKAKKRVEELEALLLDAKVREEQWKIYSEGIESVNESLPLPPSRDRQSERPHLEAEDTIAPLDL